LFLETGSHCVAQARLDSNLRLSCLYFLKAGIIDIHHIWRNSFFYFFFFAK
jgi:hypothetical protein